MLTFPVSESQKKQSEGVVFVNSALKIQYHVVKKALGCA